MSDRLSAGVLDTDLSKTVTAALQSSRKISSLYAHQAASINALMQGKNVIVSTSTASGKSVIYQVRTQMRSAKTVAELLQQVPLLMFLEEDPDATAIFIYPTKVNFVIGRLRYQS